MILAALTQDAADEGASSLVRRDIAAFYEALLINCGEDALEYMEAAGVIAEELPQTALA